HHNLWLCCPSFISQVRAKLEPGRYCHWKCHPGFKLKSEAIQRGSARNIVRNGTFHQIRPGRRAIRPEPERRGRTDLRAVWEIIWALTGGLLMAMATVGGAVAAFCAMSAGGCLWWRQRKGRARPEP
ncbi:MAG: hypothetical protein WCY92_00725, partial [Novosphingobium sp.]